MNNPDPPVNIIYIGKQIEKYYQSIEKIIKINSSNNYFSYKDEKNLYTGIFSLILIMTCSFIDEYDNYFIGLKAQKQKEILKPAISRIKQWKDLKSFRNNILAHNLRNNKKDSLIINNSIDNYNIPQEIKELHILVKCISIIYNEVLVNFKSEIAQLNTKPSNNINKIAKNEIIVLTELENIILEIERNRERYNKSF